MSVTLAPLPRAEGARVAHLEVLNCQLEFVAPIVEMLNEPEPQVAFHAVWHGEEAVGFFKIDPPGVSVLGFVPADALGLRGLLIGAQYQGKGYGASAMNALPGYLRAHYSARQVVLCVDEGNPRARDLYLANGWVETGAVHAARWGPAPVLRLML